MAAVNPYNAPRAALKDQQHEEDYQDPKMFGVSGRLGRVRLIGYSFALTFIVGAGMFLLVLLGSFLGPVGVTIATAVGYIAMLVTQWRLLIQRCHDFDTTGWLSLIAIVPLAVFFFWFMPGTDGPNRWGPKVRPNTTKTILLAVVLPVGLFLTGIIAAIALPAYQDYVKRAQQAQQVQPR